MHQWRKSLYEQLRGFSAPRVLAFSEVVALAGEVRPGVNEKSVRQFAQEAERLGILSPVRKGLWLNATAYPAPVAAEAATRIRRDAVVSLQTVLGDAGVLNNYSSQVHCVVPIRSGPNPVTGNLEAAGTIFHFRSLPESVLMAGEERDRLNSLVPYPRATAEAALVHWFYLGKSKSSRLRLPDTQCDVSLLDMDRLARLSSELGLLDVAMWWVERCREREDADDRQVGWTAP